MYFVFQGVQYKELDTDTEKKQVGESHSVSCFLFETIGKQQLHSALPDLERGNGHKQEFPPSLGALMTC